MCGLALRRLLLVGLAVTSMSGCAGATTDRLDAAQTTRVAGATSLAKPSDTAKSSETLEPAGIPKPTATRKPSATPKPTATPTPSATPEPAKQELVVLSTGFGRSESGQVVFAFTIENPNSAYVVEDSQYQVAFYDESGTVIKTESGHIAAVLPSQKLGIADTTTLPYGAKAVRAEAQVLGSNYVAAEPVPTFTITKTQYQDDQYFPKATAIIRNPYDVDLEGVRVSLIAYDAAGKIIGGGWTLQPFILANSQTGTSIDVVADGKPASCEVYAALWRWPPLGLATSAAEAKPLVLISQGFGQVQGILQDTVGYGFVLKNPNAALAAKIVPIQVIAYAADDSVLSTDFNYIEVLGPDQQVGIGEEMYVPKGSQVKRLEVQLHATAFEQSEALPAFTTDGVTYIEGGHGPVVTGTVKNPYDKNVHAWVNVVAYDAAGKIIGGGFDIINEVPANGTVAAEVPVTVPAKPAKVEMYALITTRTAIHIRL